MNKVAHSSCPRL